MLKWKAAGAGAQSGGFEYEARTILLTVTLGSWEKKEFFTNRGTDESSPQTEKLKNVLRRKKNEDS